MYNYQNSPRNIKRNADSDVEINYDVISYELVQTIDFLQIAVNSMAEALTYQLIPHINFQHKATLWDRYDSFIVVLVVTRTTYFFAIFSEFSEFLGFFRSFYGCLFLH